MSVITITEFPGVTAERFLAGYARNQATLTGIVADARGKGAVHHMFVENENGDVMVVDEWGSREQFDAFFTAQDDIKKIVAELGLAGAPATVSYRVLDTSDRF
jgi:hypothetical protein